MAVLGVLIAAGLRPDLRGRPGHDRRGVADHGAEVPAAARARPRGRHQHHPDAAAGQRLRARSPKDSLNQAVSIIRNRVDSFGVAESEVDHRRRQHRHLDPRQAGQEHPGHGPADRRAAVPPGADGRRCRRHRSRRTPRAPAADGLASYVDRRPRRRAAPPSPSPTTSANNGIVPARAAQGRREHDARRRPRAPRRPREPSGSRRRPAPTRPRRTCRQQFAELDCSDPEKVRQALREPGADDPKKPLVTCLEDGSEKYLLGPAEVLGKDVNSASAGLAQNSQGIPTGGWQVNLDFTGDGKKKFGDTTAPAVRPAPTRRTGSASSWTGWSSPHPA